MIIHIDTNSDTNIDNDNDNDILNKIELNQIKRNKEITLD